MKPRSLAVASVLVLSIAGSACNLMQPAGPPPPADVVFTAAPGAPAFPPTRQIRIFGVGATPEPGIIVDSRGAYASKTLPSPDTPHIKIGDAVVRHVDGDGLTQQKMIKLLSDEARQRGATAIVFTHCDPTLECEAALFRLAKDVDPSLRPKTAKQADTGASDSGASDVPTPGKAAPNTVIADTIEGAPATDPRWIADNPALGKALLGLWTPDASGSIPGSANTVFEKELLRSRLYINAGKKDPPTHQGNLVVYTDSQSLVNVDGAGSKPYGLPPGEIFQLALDMKMGVYLHYEGDGSVFHVIEKDELKTFIARLKKAP